MTIITATMMTVAIIEIVINNFLFLFFCQLDCCNRYLIFLLAKLLISTNVGFVGTVSFRIAELFGEITHFIY
mgnify:CR=1 FL=1